MLDTLPRLRARFAAALDPGNAATILRRFDDAAPRLLDALSELYGREERLPALLEAWIDAVVACINARPEALRQLDESRRPGWFDRPDLIGYSAYVDRFAGTLSGVSERVGYLQRLGVGYLHLLPFLRMRAGENDGGFAVSDYGEVDPALGSNADLERLAARLREAGISLCADLVLNHTADDHPWAQSAKAGSLRHRRYYRLLRDRAEVVAFEATLPQVFPQTAPANFTFSPELDAWVWTTFHHYQWDLDWSNPEVFAEMSLALLRLANLGVEVFRLDSAAYLWKRRGTPCVNLPENHRLLQALRAVADIAVPSVALKAEAIMPVRELPPYFGEGAMTGHECHLVYHSSLMAAGWAALAEGRGDIVAGVLERTAAPPRGCAWITYVRCHDDIGWRVLEEEAEGPDGFDLERVVRFLGGGLPGSYARGESYQGEAGGIHGSNGTTAALVGLADSAPLADPRGHEAALRRFLLLYGLALSASGLPVIYMGDELGLGNDEGFRADPARAGEGRWLHRPAMDWTRAQAALAHDENPAWRGLRRLVALRCGRPELAPGAPTRVLRFADPAAFGLRRGDTFIALFNFAGRPVRVRLPPGRAGAPWRDLASGAACPSEYDLEPWAMHWVEAS